MIRIKVAPVLFAGFFIFIMLISIVPFKYKYMEMFNIQFSYADVLVTLFSAVLFPLIWKGIPRKLADRASAYLYFIILYSFITILWANVYSSVPTWHTFYQIWLAFMSILIPHLLSKLTDDVHVNYEKVISNFALLLTLVFFVYYLQLDEGERFRGLMAGAAIIGIVMIPVGAVHFLNILNRKRTIVSVVAFLFTVYVLFLTQSRAALIMFVLYLAITILRKPTPARILMLVVFATVSFYSFLGQVNLDRYTNLTDDTARQLMLDSSINWGTQGALPFIFGNGYGSLWQWDAFIKGNLPWFQVPYHPTEHGYIMYHAHSVFNQLFAETGLIGLIPFILLIILITKEAIRSWRMKEEFRLNLLIAIISTLPAVMFSDLIIFFNWEVTIIWLFFTFTALNHRKHSILKS